MMNLPLRDRRDAGRQLAALLGDLRHCNDVIVLGLPRGGVPVAYEVALALDAPLDVYIVRKLGVPGHEELAMGAIATGKVRVLNDEVVREIGISQATIDAVTAIEQQELQRRQRLYRGSEGPPDIRDRVVVLVDDGLATGTTMRSAVEAVRQLGPGEVIVAVPVGAPSVCRSFSEIADRVVGRRGAIAPGRGEASPGHPRPGRIEGWGGAGVSPRSDQPAGPSTGRGCP
jgi:predicted phosphoribosyltransferase